MAEFKGEATDQPVYMNRDQIKAWEPYKQAPTDSNYKENVQTRMKKVGHWSKHQVAGKRWGIGCVSLEVTQRCNLDCTLCYLSDNSEAVKDTPLEEIFRRIEMIRAHYGPNTDVQISGGDPTLRDHNELVLIVRKIRAEQMRCSFFTNGIKASRELLSNLAKEGLTDVAFHVDLTQERKGYATEMELNKIRKDYIERARGLGLNIIFNTTVYANNFKEVPQLVRFFIDNSDMVSFASFQLQADTGRGVLRERDFVITQETMMAQIREGAGININFDVPLIGHPKCNKYSNLLSINGRLYDFFDDPEFIMDFLNNTTEVEFDRNRKMQTAINSVVAAAKQPHLLVPGLKFVGKKLWQTKADLIKAKGKVNKIGFFIHNFMDACKLEEDRVEGCVFMVATNEGPISMCMHNAKRDHFILQPVKLQDAKIWNPLTGELLEEKVAENIFKSAQLVDPQSLPLKHTKGRVRAEKMVTKKAGTPPPTSPEVNS
jgi:uncharacterized radical SAM superfamily Fe-S cluster-containing enzyme